MSRILTVLILILSLSLCSCLAAQLKWDREVQSHMETLTSTPDETVLAVVEEWNTQPDLKDTLKVDIAHLQENIEKLEFDNKKGYLYVHYKQGMDQQSQLVMIGQVMVIFGKLYWLLPEQTRETIYVYGMFEGDEKFAYSWAKGADQPVIDDERINSYM